MSLPGPAGAALECVQVPFLAKYRHLLPINPDPSSCHRGVTVLILAAALAFLEVIAMLSDEMRSLLMHGKSTSAKLRVSVARLGGSASVLVAWKRHKAELIAACPAGRRPWAFWFLEKRLRNVPRDDVAQARAIRTFGIYANDAEKAIVHRRLDAVVQARRAWREAARVA